MAEKADNIDSTKNTNRGIGIKFALSVLFFMSASIAAWTMLFFRDNPLLSRNPDVIVIALFLIIPMLPFLFVFWSLKRYVTDRERRDQSMIRQLDERVSYYQGINNSSQNGYLVFDNTHYHIIDSNSVAPIILGATHNSLIGTDIRELFGDVVWPEKGLPFRQSEIEFTMNPGTTTHILATLANLNLPGQDLAVMSFVDINRRKKTEKALQESRSRFDALFHSVPIGLYQSTANGIGIEANNTLVEILGFPDVATLLTTPTENLYEDVSDRNRMIRALSGSGGVVVNEARMRQYNGALIWARITAHVTHKDDSGTRYLEAAIQDITDQKAREAESKSMKMIDSQNRKMTTIGTLAVAVAHESNNILAGMKLRIQVFRTKDFGKTVEEDLNYFEAAVDRAATQVEGLLAVSGEPLVQTSIIDINDIVSEGIGTVRRTYDNQINWKEQLSSEPLTVLANRHQLEFTVLELLKNAAYAIEEKGSVKVYCTKEIPGRILSTILPFYDKPHATIIVQDTGRGMSPETLDRVFEPFFTTAELGADRGLGLTKIYGIINRHHGGITVESKPGVGTTIMVFLPLRAE